MSACTAKRLKLVNESYLDGCCAANAHCGSYMNGYIKASDLLQKLNGHVKIGHDLNMNMQNGQVKIAYSGNGQASEGNATNGQEMNGDKMDDQETGGKDLPKKADKVQPWMIPGQTDLTFIRQLADLAINEGLMKGMDRKE